MLTKVLRLYIFCILSFLCTLCYVNEDNQTAAYMKHADTSHF